MDVSLSPAPYIENRRLLRVLLYAAVSVSLLLSGCARNTVDVSAVTQFANKVAAASKTMDDLASDLYVECRLTREYAGETRLAASGLNAKTSSLSAFPLEPSFPDRPVESVSGTAPTPPVKPSTELPRLSMITGDPKCVLARSLSARWKLENDAVVLYVKKLGEIAGLTTSPDKKEYEKLGDSLKKAGIFSSDKVAEAAGDFVASIGNEIIKGRQQAALIDVIQRSQRDGLPAILDQLYNDAATQYYNQLRNAYSTVNARFSSVIGDELNEIKYLRTYDGQSADPTPEPTAHTPPPFVPPQKRCSPNCQRHARLRARIAILRDGITEQRARWQQIDDKISANASLIAPYHKLIFDIAKTNESLVKQGGPGIPGLIDAVKPWLSDLSDQASALAEAAH